MVALDTPALGERFQQRSNKRITEPSRRPGQPVVRGLDERPEGTRANANHLAALGRDASKLHDASVATSFPGPADSATGEPDGVLRFQHRLTGR